MRTMQNNIAGKVVVITEATSAPGKAIARHLSEEGAKLVLGGRDLASLNDLSDEIVWDGGKVLVVATDMTDCSQAAQLFAAAEKILGRVDVMVNNLVLRPELPFSDDETGNVNLIAGVQILGIVHGVVAAIPYLRRHGGHIINIAPLDPLGNHSDRTAAAAIRKAVCEASEKLGEQVTPDGIRTTLVAPGFTRDSAWAHLVTRRSTLQHRVVTEAVSVARAVALVINEPDNLEINEIHVRHRHPRLALNDVPAGYLLA